MSADQNHHARTAQYASIEAPERQVEATLALAYEQRTANLIAYRAVANTIILSGSSLTLEYAKQIDAADKQITERLGL